MFPACHATTSVVAERLSVNYIIANIIPPESVTYNFSSPQSSNACAYNDARKGKQRNMSSTLRIDASRAMSDESRAQELRNRYESRYDRQ